MNLGALSERPFAFAVACLLLDFAFGDPVFRLHPVRLLGLLLTHAETLLRRAGLDGRFGGFLLFLLLAGACGAVVFGGGALLDTFHAGLAGIWYLFFGWSALALRNLLEHAARIQRAVERNDLEGARRAAGMLVGRDTDRMDLAACNRAAVESVAEGLVDGVLAPLFWICLLGLPGGVLFKIASTLDSMVGYKSERYLYFGWFGARLDDIMNWIPARLSAPLIALAALPFPGLSARAALRVSWRQHQLLPGPNKGWSEAAMAGALGRRIVGPIWRGGTLVTDLWIGDPAHPPCGDANDVRRALRSAVLATLLFLPLGWLLATCAGHLSPVLSPF